SCVGKEPRRPIRCLLPAAAEAPPIRGTLFAFRRLAIAHAHATGTEYPDPHAPALPLRHIGLQHRVSPLHVARLIRSSPHFTLDGAYAGLPDLRASPAAAGSTVCPDTPSPPAAVSASPTRLRWSFGGPGDGPS